MKDVNSEYEIKYKQNQLFYKRVFTWQALDEQSINNSEQILKTIQLFERLKMCCRTEKWSQQK